MEKEYTNGRMDRFMTENGNKENKMVKLQNNIYIGKGKYYIPNEKIREGLWKDGNFIKWIESDK